MNTQFVDPSFRQEGDMVQGNDFPHIADLLRIDCPGIHFIKTKVSCADRKSSVSRSLSLFNTEVCDGP